MKKKLNRYLFFGSIFSLILEGFIEFMMSGILQIFGPNGYGSGEIIANFLGLIGLSFSIILIFAIIRTLFFSEN